MAGTQNWISQLGLEDRLGTQDLILRGDSIIESPHAGAIQSCFLRLGLSGVAMVGSVPTIGFLDQPTLDQEEIDLAHRALWNQGLLSVLIVSLPAEVRIYTLWEPPIEKSATPAHLERLIVEVLHSSSDALRMKTLLAEIESGRYFEDHQSFFRENARVDSTLLSNLTEAERRLRKNGLDSTAARAVLLQIIFISYLEDRRIVDRAYYRDRVRITDVGSFIEILKLNSFATLVALFRRLRRDFNGDIFYGPCSFGPDKGPRLSPEHIEILDDFRSGSVELATGQLRFWPFDFSYVPVELISSIYDRFLNEQDSDRRSFGSYFTPTFLADIAVDQAWEALRGNTGGDPDILVLDPACGSGIFLVRVFQRMIRAWRSQHRNVSPPWRTLKAFLNRLHGIDKQADAVRISVFSLYIALLEEVEPPAIVDLLRIGRILPRLFGKTLLEADFFSPRLKRGRYDLVIGNPPWVSRNSTASESAMLWCETNEFPMPQKEVAWAFLWKAQVHAKRRGIIALLLPAMGILHNHTEAAQEARRLWLKTAKLVKVINFSDVRFQLFEDADRPTVLAIYSPAAGAPYEFQYWCPKATKILSAAKILVVSPIDQWAVNSRTAEAERFFWKRRIWAGGRELRLLDLLMDFPKLRQLVSSYRDRNESELRGSGNLWTIGQGFQELHSERVKGRLHGFTTEPTLTRIPFLDTSSFQPWAIPTLTSPPWSSPRVRRAGFVPGYFGPRILVIKGVQQKTGLIRAAYVEQDFSFRHSIQAITFPVTERAKAKLLAAILNSQLAAWFLFHISASLGTERPEVHIDELLELPFPQPSELSKEAVATADQIVGMVDQLVASRDAFFVPDTEKQVHLIDRLVSKFFGLNEDEVGIIEEGVTKVIPSMQPRRGTDTALLRGVGKQDELDYATTLIATLQRWVKGTKRLQATLLGGQSPWRAIQLRFTENAPTQPVVIDQNSAALIEAIHQFMSALPAHHTRNFYFASKLKVFVGDTLILVKPLDSRFWLRTVALNDADEIAADLLMERHEEAVLQSHR
jgi:hypothetical protein